jgi:hypothetical protein
MPVLRNPQYYFKEGFCWTNVLNPQARLLKVKLKNKSVNDVGSMSLISILNSTPNYFLTALLNSEILFDYYREFINCTVNIQINDIRQLPIIIPTEEQLNICNNIFQEIIKIKKDASNKKIILYEEKEDVIKLEEKINIFVEKLYKFI